MANKRMYLVNKRTGDRVCLAKYSPHTGWYNRDQNLAVAINEMFFRVGFFHLMTQRQVENEKPGDEWALEYETVSSE